MQSIRYIPSGKGRRTVGQISEYKTPQELYKLITQQHWPYSTRIDYYRTRDLALKAGYVLTGGRETEVLKLTRDMCEKKDTLLLIKGMDIVKRTEKAKQKYGDHITKRATLAFPLAEDLFDLPGYNELIPFTWLLLDHIEQVTKPEDYLFPFSGCRAWQIVKATTGMFPNWFRAQCEMVMGSLLKDSVKLAKFIGVVRPEQVGHYIGYDYRQHLKEKSDAERSWYCQYLRS